MCLSCRCGKPNDNHGNAANITMKDLREAAKAGGVKTAKQAAKNIVDTLAGKVKPDAN